MPRRRKPQLPPPDPISQENNSMSAKFPKITEEGLADLRARIGVKITNTVEPWNYEATRDAMDPRL